jgi:hypothetical protein
MSTKYQKPFIIPDGFPALLKRFTREILRAQVQNMSDAYQFQRAAEGSASSVMQGSNGIVLSS